VFHRTTAQDSAEYPDSHISPLESATWSETLAELDEPERLALAVEAQLTAIRADQAQERSALVERKAAPLLKAIAAHIQLYGEDADPTDHFDVLMGLIVRNGGGNLGKEDLLVGMQMYEERVAAARTAADAMHELNEAMCGHTGPVLEWVGCTREVFVAALESKITA